MLGDSAVKNFKLGKSDLTVPAVAVGCMRISNMSDKALAKHLEYCIEQGLNFFDHADIYGKGRSEERFCEVFSQLPYKREDIILQSKCGIRKNMYDFSKEHILSSVDGSLKRLGTDYLDVLLLHRPDALCEPEEVAEAFDILKSSGKVRYFGVSNHRPLQIELLKQYLNQDLLVNQLQFGPAHSTMISSGLEANMITDGAVDRDGSVLDYSRLNKITIQAWSPFMFGYPKEVFVGSEKMSKLNAVLEELAAEYNTTPMAVATAWILRHPANIQMIAGTTDTDRMAQIVNGIDITLSREQWYKIYLSAGHILP